MSGIKEFEGEELVKLKQLVRGSDGTLFYPGEYKVDELPSAAFAANAVAKILKKAVAIDEQVMPSQVASVEATAPAIASDLKPTESKTK